MIRWEQDREFREERDQGEMLEMWIIKMIMKMSIGLGCLDMIGDLGKIMAFWEQNQIVVG